MATVLPALSRDKQKSTGTLPGLSVPRSGRGRAPKIQKGTRPSVGKLAGIEKADVSQFRNTYKHNLSIEILQEGYVSSFIELFELFDKQSEDRKKAGSESGARGEPGVHEVPLLIDEHEKLDMLKSKLIEAEEARRTGEPDKSYMAFLDLAHYFEQFPADEWLIDNFHSQCMSESLRVAGDGGRKQAEANFNIGVALEKRGDLSSAVEYLETFYTLSMEQEWQDKMGDSLHDQACLQLYKTYTCLAEEIYEASPTGAIDYLKKAYSMAKEGGDRQEEGVASHRLGNAYEAVGDPEVATMYHKGYLERCKRDKDKLGIGRAHEALARCYQSEGKLELAAENYKEFVKIAEESGDADVVSQASSSLATLYNMLGEYSLAVEYYAKAGAVATNQDSERIELKLLRAVLYEKEDNFVALCNPEKQEDEETEPEKPDFTFRDEFGQTVLEKAAVLGKIELIPSLLAYEVEGVKIDVNEADPQEYTALHKAAAWGKVGSLKCLIANGADFSLETCYSETARDLALRYHHNAAVLLLDITAALHDYNEKITDIHRQVTDPERIMGKLNKEEKGTSHKLCEEALEWVKSSEVENVDEVIEQQDAFLETMQQYLIKIVIPEDLNINQAISQSHHKLSCYSTTILPNTYRLNSSLVEWKDYRDESFIGLSRPATRADSEIPPSGTPSSELPVEGHATPK